MRLRFGCAFIVFACWFMKLNAAAMQQKIFGEWMGAKSDTVLSTVGVNKPFIRACEVILKQPGIGLGKCAALCGGHNLLQPAAVPAPFTGAAA